MSLHLQIAASDALIGKIGYGTVSECLAHGKPLVFVRRDYFNEEPFLRRLLQMHGAAVEIRRRDFLEGQLDALPGGGCRAHRHLQV